ncbi:hypothetical protein IV203_004477 [Nitzschia inconspicua]|uniref:Uncharacterized protein n=1 Tax=Nitzschia inconspicua TaxID=303405 RepID=A0A9K3PQ48_9STRA|nr:hypothetical protein IV203_004477 [Nitzschia inconspicua]
MPPVLDPTKSKVDGLAFLGLSLARYHDEGHPDSVTHQTAFDLNQVLDRDYEFLFSTNDDGWLVGGGEPGPPTTYKLAAKDSAHVEIMRIGTYRKEWGGVPLEEILSVMQSGEILIPQIEALPTAVVANPDNPPELEIRFDMEPEIPNFEDLNAPLPTNWQLRFLHNQFFKKFIFPSRFCPGAFHSTILRKAEFRSEEHRKNYFAKCDAAIAEWRKAGPQPLNTIPRSLTGEPLEQPTLEQLASKKSDLSYPDDEQIAEAEEKKDDESFAPNQEATRVTNLEVSLAVTESVADDGTCVVNVGDVVFTAYGEGKVVSAKMESESVEVELPYGRLFVRLTESLVKKEVLPADKLSEPKAVSDVPVPASECHSGIWLFTDRENITHFFKPNFFPPYNTPEKKKIILDVLREEWDEKTLSWKPCGQGSMTKRKATTNPAMLDISPLSQLDELMDGVLSTINGCCTPQANATNDGDGK